MTSLGSNLSGVRRGDSVGFWSDRWLGRSPRFISASLGFISFLLISWFLCDRLCPSQTSWISFTSTSPPKPLMRIGPYHQLSRAQTSIKMLMTLALYLEQWFILLFHSLYSSVCGYSSFQHDQVDPTNAPPKRRLSLGLSSWTCCT